MDTSTQIARLEERVKSLEVADIIYSRRIRLLEEQNDRLHAAIFQRRPESVMARLVRRIRLAIWGREIAKC